MNQMIHAQSGYAQTAPVAESPVDSALTLLSDHAKELRQRLSTLQDRLRVVSALPPPASVANKAERPVALSPLEEGVAIIEGELQIALATVNSIFDNLRV